MAMSIGKNKKRKEIGHDIGHVIDTSTSAKTFKNKLIECNHMCWCRNLRYLPLIRSVGATNYSRSKSIIIYTHTLCIKRNPKFKFEPASIIVFFFCGGWGLNSRPYKYQLHNIMT